MTTFLKKYWPYLSIPIILIIFAYFNSLRGGLIADDFGLADYPNVLKNPVTAETFQSILTFSLRALLLLLFGQNTLPYHLLSLLLHIGNTILVFIVINKLLNKRVAFITSLFFAVHPILTETVSWFSAAGYLQYTFFFLLSFYLYLISKKRTLYYILSVVSFGLMLLSFNRSIPLFLVFPLYEFSLGNLRQNYKKLLPYLSLTIIWFITSLFMIPGRQEQVKVVVGDISKPNPLLSVPAALETYLKLLFWPDGLSFLHSFYTVNTYLIVFRIGIVLVLLGLLIYFYLKNRIGFFFLSFWLVNLILFLVPIGIASFVAERYTYTGSIGILAIVSFYLVKLSKQRDLKPFIYGLIAIVVFALSIRTIVRNQDWQSETAIYNSVLRVYPYDTRAMNIVGSHLFQQGSKTEAKSVFEKAIKANPNSPEAYNNLGNYYFDKQSYPEAVALYEKALAKDETFAQAYGNLANIYYIQENYEVAYEFVKAALQFAPKNVNNYLLAGNILLKVNQKTEAQKAFAGALTIDPNNSQAKDGLEKSQPKSP